MNKQELIDAVAAQTGASKAQTGETLDTLLEVIKKAVSKGDSVQLIGFGSFGSGKRAARTGRNPRRRDHQDPGSQDGQVHGWQGVQGRSEQALKRAVREQKTRWFQRVFLFDEVFLPRRIVFFNL